eukprot:6947051-Karenia_brevis.AAC.1
MAKFEVLCQAAMKIKMEKGMDPHVDERQWMQRGEEFWELMCGPVTSAIIFFWRHSAAREICQWTFRGMRFA